MNLRLINQAQEFAHEAHNRIAQKRKYTDEPYWVHTDAVAETVTGVGGDQEMIMAAHLHDVLEDVTPLYPAFSEGQIRVMFGEGTLMLVKELTDVYTSKAYPKLNRAARKEEELKRIFTISNRAKTIKLADILDNSKTIVPLDIGFARVYLREVFSTLPALIGGDSGLLQKVSMQTALQMMQLGLPLYQIDATIMA